MSGSITDFDGDRLYLDTMIPYALLRSLDPSVQALFERIERGEIRAYTSVLTFDELSYRLLLAAVRDTHTGSPLDHLRRNEAAIIQQFYPPIAVQLAHLRTFPNLTVVDLTVDDLASMDDAMQRYHLRPRDALHLATMQKVGCLNLASNDGDWERVPMVERYAVGP